MQAYWSLEAEKSLGVWLWGVQPKLGNLCKPRGRVHWRVSFVGGHQLQGAALRFAPRTRRYPAPSSLGTRDRAAVIAALVASRFNRLFVVERTPHKPNWAALW